MIYLEGVVSSGMQKASKFIELPVYKKQYEHKLGFTPYPGTLNIKLQNDIEVDVEDEYANKLQKISGEGKYGDVFFLFASLSTKDNTKTKKGAILFPVRSVYTTDTLEFVCEDNLRKTMDLKNGDVVVLKFRE
ncbi:DUF120 domain-containing protein [Methanosphaera cuniculi]|uniref:DUF120 domain-containing protein n=1 Tax=Methanosphaera cuniculi TaxID=1077256 RepID=UPI0026DCCCD2|nr:DUF120 domain-containing protein [Methanosphaera cuniculi]